MYRHLPRWLLHYDFANKLKYTRYPNPKVNVLAIDPQNGTRFLEVRGEVTEITEKRAIAHADKQTRLYSNDKQQRFYGDIYPAEQQEKETRVIVKISPQKVTTDAAIS